MTEEHIKINPVPTKVKYSGNGVVREFPTGFAFFEDDNIVVYHNGVIINTGYSVTGVGETDGGVVTFDVAPAEGDKIVIIRKVAIERVTDFQEGGAFRAKNINDELDRQTAFCQQIEEEMSRCVKVEVTDDQDPKELIDKVFDQLDLAIVTGEAAIKAAEEANNAAVSAQNAAESAEKTAGEAIANITAVTQESITTAEAAIEAEKQNAVGEIMSKGQEYVQQANNSATSAAASAKSAADSADRLNSLLPSQADNAGKYLTTDGTNPSWAELKVTPHIVVQTLPTELEEDTFYYIPEA